MNQAIHTIDQLYHLIGDVESVCAFAKRAAHERIEVEDVAVAILRFKNGKSVVLRILQREPDFVLVRGDSNIRHRFGVEVGRRLLDPGVVAKK